MSTDERPALPIFGFVPELKRSVCPLAIRPRSRADPKSTIHTISQCFTSTRDGPLGPLGLMQSHHSRTPGGSADRASTRQNRLGGGLQVCELDPGGPRAHTLDL